MTTLRSELNALTRIAWPIAMSQLALMLMGLVEMSILGHDSVTELGGASVGRSIGHASSAIAMGVASALDPIASQAVGAGEHSRARQAFRVTMKACAILWVPLSIFAYASTWLLRPLGIDPVLIPIARSFLIGQMPSLLFFTFFICAKTFLQAHGRMQPLVWGTFIGNISNWVLCSLFVGGDAVLVRWGLPALGLPKMGAFGAGLAGSASTLVVWLITFFAAQRSGPEGEASAETKVVSLREIFRIGMPIGFQFLAEIGVFALIAVIAGKLGVNVASAHQIALGLASFTFMITLGVSSATSVRVGHAIGRRENPRRAGLVGISFGGAMMVISAAVFAIFPEPLVQLFTHDKEVTRLAASLLRIAAAFQFFDGVQGVSAGALRGAGDVRIPFFVNVGAYWLFGLPLALVLGFSCGWGAAGFWWGLTAGIVVVAVLLARRFWVLTRQQIERI